MQPPASMYPPKPSPQRRTWTDDQMLGTIANDLESLAYVVGSYRDVDQQSVDYVLHKLSGLRRALLALKADDEATCRQCGGTFTPIRSTAVYCSAACRQAAYRERDAIEA